MGKEIDLEDILDSIINFIERYKDKVPSGKKYTGSLTTEDKARIIEKHKIGEKNFIDAVKIGVNQNKLIYHGNIESDNYAAEDIMLAKMIKNDAYSKK